MAWRTLQESFESPRGTPEGRPKEGRRNRGIGPRTGGVHLPFVLTTSRGALRGRARAASCTKPAQRPPKDDYEKPASAVKTFGDEWKQHPMAEDARRFDDALLQYGLMPPDVQLVASP